MPFEQRCARFDEALVLVRASVRGESSDPGTFYDLDELRLDPVPALAPEVWFGGRGSEQRLRAMAQMSDGWMASGYNPTPQRFAEARKRLDDHLSGFGRDPEPFLT